MNINSITTNLNNLSELSSNNNTKQKEGFLDLFKKEIEDLNAKLQKASESSEKLATGETTDIISVSYDIMQAEVAMKLTVQIRNKILQAYQTFQHMQV